MQHRKTERGQIMVLLVLAVVVLFGFAALSVDGGMLYVDRRRAQRAADAAALAAAMSKLQDQNWYNKAFEIAAQNGYKNDGSHDVVSVYSPPVSGRYAGDSQYVQVVITSTVQSSFAHLLYDGPMKNSVAAVARAKPAQNLLLGNAMVGANKTDCKSIWFAGTGDISITGGGNVFSNSDANAANCQSGVQNGSGRVTVGDGGEIQVAGGFSGDSSHVSPWPVNTGVPQVDLPSLPTPYCADLGYWGAISIHNGDDLTLSPGRYDKIQMTGGKVHFNPGLYCINGDFTSNGGEVEGLGVMFYVANGDITLNGGSSLYLEASTDLIDGAGNQWAGMLFFMPFSNDGLLSLAGGSESSYIGTIYAPGPPHSHTHKCTFTGNSGNFGLRSQVICDRVKVTGTGDVSIHYVPEENYPLPPTVELAQ